MAKRWFIIGICLLLSIATYAQSKKKKRKNKSSKAPVEQPSALNPGPSEKTYGPKVARKPSKGATYNAEQEFYERMEELEKTKRKNEKLAAKPQYSDPMYFGHKKPPKKRKPGKMRYCKECGIRH
ncbi:MAG TPA: hypothetical protein VGD65_12800 [Chryseosolibacter sp.]